MNGWLPDPSRVNCMEQRRKLWKAVATPSADVGVTRRVYATLIN